MRPALLVLPALSALLVVGCASGPGAPGGSSSPGASGSPAVQTRTATGLSLSQQPKPDDTVLHVRYTADALLDRSHPVAHVDVTQTADRITLVVVINERKPAPGEAIPNYAVLEVTDVRLDRPVGAAAVLDAGTQPPTVLQVRP